MSINDQGHSLTLVKGHSDFKVKCLNFGLYTQVSDSGPLGPLVHFGTKWKINYFGWSNTYALYGKESELVLPSLEIHVSVQFMDIPYLIFVGYLIFRHMFGYPQAHMFGYP